MSAPAAAASPPALRFDGAVVEGPLPPPKPERVRSTLSQTLSPAAAAVHAAVTARWRAEHARDARTPALRLLSSLPPGCAADEATVLKAARRYLALSSGKAAASCPLAEDPPVHAGLDVFHVAADDERIALRGQCGVRAREPLAAGVVLGLLRCEVLSHDEFDAFKHRAPSGAEADCGPLAPAEAVPHELAVNAFGHEFDRFNAEREAAAEAADVEKPTRLYASALGYGNAVSLVNDGRAVPPAAPPYVPGPGMVYFEAAAFDAWTGRCKKAGLVLVYAVWAIFAWLTITYASLIYRMLDPATEADLLRTWLVSIGLDQATQLRDGIIQLTELLLLAYVLEALWLVPNSRWLEQRIDFLSVQAAVAGGVWGRPQLQPPAASRWWRRNAASLRRLWANMDTQLRNRAAIS